MDQALRQLVWDRAESTCEYCRTPHHCDEDMPFQVDHIIAEKHDGPTDENNLALSCYNCNSYKGSNVAGVDSESGDVVRLFHPRKDIWQDHFRWDGPELVGLRIRSAQVGARIE